MRAGARPARRHRAHRHENSGAGAALAWRWSRPLRPALRPLGTVSLIGPVAMATARLSASSRRRLFQPLRFVQDVYDAREARRLRGARRWRTPTRPRSKKAFRKLARELHPDVNNHDPQAEGKFKEAAEAYEIPLRRRQAPGLRPYGHDGLKRGGQSPNFEGSARISDLFGRFFGGGGGGAGASADRPRAAAGMRAVNVEIGPRSRRPRAPDRRHLRGRRPLRAAATATAAEPGTPIKTWRALRRQRHPAGRSRTHFDQSRGPSARRRLRRRRQGREKRCTRCDGRGREVLTHAVSIDVPAGIDTGQRSGLRRGPRESGASAAISTSTSACASTSASSATGNDLVTVLDVPAPLAALGTKPRVRRSRTRRRPRAPGTQPGEGIVSGDAGMPLLAVPAAAATCASSSTSRHPAPAREEQRSLLTQLAASMTDANMAPTSRCSPSSSARCGHRER